MSHKRVRLATHMIALTIAIGLASYTSVSHGLPSNLLRLGVENAQARSMAQGGQVGDLALGRQGVLIKPLTAPAAVTVRHEPIVHTVADGETLQTLATKFNLTIDEIRWSNPTLGTSTHVKPGDQLLIPPITGVVVQVRQGDTVASLAAAWHADPVSIVDFNYLRDPVADLTDGRFLILPAGHGSTLTPQPYGTYLPAAVGARSAFAIKVGGTLGPNAVTRFPYGQCTFYAATKVNIPWNGNAWTWYDNAQTVGWRVGSTPRAGSLMITWESPYYGHVAFVEGVNGDGSWTVSEMNYVGWGVIDQRTIHPGQVSLIGFIYPPQ